MIYLISSGNGDAAEIKIGNSKNLIERKSKLQIGNPNPLHVIAKLDGDHNAEAALHRHLAMYATPSNEWFYPCPEVLNMKNWIVAESISRLVPASEVIRGLVNGRFRRNIL